MYTPFSYLVVLRLILTRVDLSREGSPEHTDPSYRVRVRVLPFKGKRVGGNVERDWSKTKDPLGPRWSKWSTGSDTFPYLTPRLSCLGYGYHPSGRSTRIRITGCISGTVGIEVTGSDLGGSTRDSRDTTDVR